MRCHQGVMLYIIIHINTVIGGISQYMGKFHSLFSC